MGHSYASVTVYNKDSTKSERISLLADTGSTYTWIRKATLEKLGLEVDPVTKELKKAEVLLAV